MPANRPLRPAVPRVKPHANGAKFANLHQPPPRTIYFPVTLETVRNNLVLLMNAPATSEIGVHMALGAQRRRVLRMILSEALGLLAAGLVLGVILLAVTLHPSIRFRLCAPANKRPAAHNGLDRECLDFANVEYNH